MLVVTNGISALSESGLSDQLSSHLVPQAQEVSSRRQSETAAGANPEGSGKGEERENFGAGSEARSLAPLRVGIPAAPDPQARQGAQGPLLPSFEKGVPVSPETPVSVDELLFRFYRRECVKQDHPAIHRGTVKGVKMRRTNTFSLAPTEKQEAFLMERADGCAQEKDTMEIE